MQHTEAPDHVYQPNGSEVTGPACFLDQARICGSDCMAYLPQPPDNIDFKGEQWARCHLLVNAHRAGKHLTIIASVLSKADKKEHPVTKQPPPGVR